VVQRRCRGGSSSHGGGGVLTGGFVRAIKVMGMGDGQVAVGLHFWFAKLAVGLHFWFA